MWRKEPRLVVTIDEKKRAQCEAEVLELLNEAGIPHAELLKGAPQGMVEVYFESDPKVAVERLTDLCRQDPFAFANTYHWTPVEAWTEADKRHLAQFMHEYDNQIRPGESWKVEVHKSASALSSQAVLAAVAELIEHPNVRLDHPDKTIHLELVGSKAGVSLLRPNDRLDVGLVTREEFVEFKEMGPRHPKE